MICKISRWPSSHQTILAKGKTKYIYCCPFLMNAIFSFLKEMEKKIYQINDHISYT